jgi:geranylgeranyl transferase type-1 subunit beta
MGCLDMFDQDRIVHWLIQRQSMGFHGRINKPDDTCYSFWVGASLKIFKMENLINLELLEGFLQETISKYGGYGKTPGTYPDVMHSYMGLAGLSLVGRHGLGESYAPLGMSMRAFEYAKSIGYCIKQNNLNK